MSLLASDLDRAQAFYGGLFGWRYKHVWRQEHDNYSLALVDTVPGVGLTAPSQNMGLAVSWTAYFAADSADSVARRVQERGGTVAVGPLEFGTGRVAWAADPAGALFGIWEGEFSSSWWTDRRPGTLVWLELRTRDAFDAALFYGAVFDWDAKDKSRQDVRYEHDRVVLTLDGEAVASLSGGLSAAAPDPTIRPRWYVYFRVDDVDAVASRAVDLGGSVVSAPAHSPYGRVATLCDAEGGLFNIASFAHVG